MPMRGEIRAVTSAQKISPARAAWLRIHATISDSDLQCVTLFCAVGFLLTVNIILRVPDFAATVATLKFFP